MRKATNDYGIIINDDGTFLGFALGYDYCAEHEWGIEDLKRECGIFDSTKKNMGVKSRTLTKTPLFVFKKETYKKQKYAILYSGQDYWGHIQLAEHLPDELKNYKSDIKWELDWNEKHKTNDKDKKDPIITAWNGSSFGIAVMGEKEVEYLEELKEALENKNIIIATLDFSQLNPFAGTSLCIIIANRLPQENKDAMYNVDKKYYDREDYEKKIGMKKVIEKNRKLKNKLGDGSWKGNLYGHDHGYYMACSPKWINYENKEAREKKKKNLNTKYDISYWVNYSDNDDNYSWCTVEEIKEWLTSKIKLSEILARRIKKEELVLK